MTDFLTKEWWQQATLEDVKEKFAIRYNVNLRNRAGLSPLILAASYSSDVEIIKTLLENGAELAAKDWITGSVLANAAKYNPHPEIIKTLVQAGAPVNEEDIVEEMTPLMQAAKYNPNPEVIKTLLELGADAGMRDEQNKTALDYFERAEEYPEIKKLLEVKETDIDFENIDEEKTDIMQANMENCREFINKDREYFSLLLSEYLTPRDERVLRMHFGIGMNEAQTLEEIGKQFNVSSERVKQVEAKALRKLIQKEFWEKIEHLPYWGNSPEEKLLRCLHLAVEECRKYAKQES